MDYEKKYKEALERAERLHSEPTGGTERIVCEQIFPELAESEDERIRKALIKIVHDTTDVELWMYYNVHKEEALAWLKKQGQVKESPISQHEIKTCKENDDSLTSEDKKIRGAIIDHLKDNNLTEWAAWLGKQGSQILDNSAKTCKDEQKPIDKAEPKFHEGEWLQYRNAKPFFVEEITKQGYVNGDSCLPFNWENEIHLWTIQDAKDGDVLASNSSVFIFKEEYIAEKPIAHCGIMNGRFIKGKDVCWTNQRYYPATKEQRDLLFQKMKEAGYEWDADKKELKKISNELEEREIVHIEHGKYYYCIKDYYAGGNKRASKGDVVQALNGMSMMALGVKANKYFMPINNIEQKTTDKCEGCNNVKGCVACVDGSAWAHIDEKNSVAWSEEDEENMNNALYILNQLKDTSSYKEDDIAEKIIVWLKSLKQRIGG